MKKFIGDLSMEDAELIERYVSRALSVLEFGVGGSTQIIAQTITPGAHFLSVDTDPSWIKSTRQRLARLGVEERCEFRSYDGWWAGARANYDLIFVDGRRDLRRSFARRAWSVLSTNGVMLVHDTRRESDMEDVLSLMRAHFEEVLKVHLNEPITVSEERGEQSSNITAIFKKSREPYLNWRDVEGQPDWKYGLAAEPVEFWQ